MRQKQGVFSLFLLSLSSRRAWIEIRHPAAENRETGVALLAEGVDRNGVYYAFCLDAGVSLSSRRAWIEIQFKRCIARQVESLSSRRAWIEIR